MHALILSQSDTLSLQQASLQSEMCIQHLQTYTEKGCHLPVVSLPPGFQRCLADCLTRLGGDLPCTTSAELPRQMPCLDQVLCEGF